ncbi:hypothetical protein [Rothia nasimurium]|nr:hypothetical protein [Rothia nasimurium]
MTDFEELSPGVFAAYTGSALTQVSKLNRSFNSLKQVFHGLKMPYTVRLY